MPPFSDRQALPPTQEAQEIGVCRRSTLTWRSESYGALKLWTTIEFVGISDKEQRRFKHDFWRWLY